MKRLRIRIITLAFWLISFFLVDRLFEPVAISNTAIAFALLITVLTLIIPRIANVRVLVMILIPVIALLAVRINAEKPITGINTFQAIVEACAIGITTALAYRVSMGLKEFEQAVEQISFDQQEKINVTALGEHSSIYREVRRARNHQRPLALLSIGIDEKSINITGDQSDQEIKFFMLKQLKLRGVLKMLCKELEDCAIIVKENNHFLAVLPETKPEEMLVIVERLRRKANEEVGVEIKIGTASLPEDSYTFEGLVDKANREMQSDREPISYLAVEQYPLKRPAKEDQG